jgi:hypothetical protein
MNKLRAAEEACSAKPYEPTTFQPKYQPYRSGYYVSIELIYNIFKGQGQWLHCKDNEVIVHVFPRHLISNPNSFIKILRRLQPNVVHSYKYVLFFSLITVSQSLNFVN